MGGRRGAVRMLVLRGWACSLPIIPPLLHRPILFCASRAGTTGKAANSESTAESGERQQEKYRPILSPRTRPQAVNVGRGVLCAEKKKKSAAHTSCSFMYTYKVFSISNVLFSSLVIVYFCIKTHTKMDKLVKISERACIFHL